MTEETGVTKYLPKDWLDEAIPAPQRDVNDFIHRAEGGTFLLMPKDEADQQEECWCTSLEPGQVVAFRATEWYGWHTVHVDDDGRVGALTVPARANCLCLDGDTENLTDDLSEMVKCGRGDGPLAPGAYDITVYWWDESDTRFRFVVDADGAGRFEPCAGAS
ncbi:hypothetical protein [Shinella sp. BYT-45]|uniref:hypothetical protein n=1 Tax=Shinella sp. BYT-45 TaxID=3377377 RepID=UPI0039802090